VLGRRSLAAPTVEYLRRLEAKDRYRRLVTLIPEVQPARPWQWIMHNQRGRVLDRAIRRGTASAGGHGRLAPSAPLPCIGHP
jgi:hypothetical protein